MAGENLAWAPVRAGSYNERKPGHTGFGASTRCWCVLRILIHSAGRTRRAAHVRPSRIMTLGCRRPRMLSILLTADDHGGTAWRHLLAHGDARAGWECVGPWGFARRLGRILGVWADPAPFPDRLAAYTARLERHDDGSRSYSESRHSDRYGVASHLLALRDRLKLAGWQGQPLAGSARLADLAAIEAFDSPPLPPGLGDVLQSLRAEVGRALPFPVPITIHLAAPREGYPPALLSLLDALVGAGAIVHEASAETPAAAPATDLGRLQRALLDPAAPRASLAGDGSFLLLEVDTPVEATELGASVLRDQPLADTTVVVAAEPAALDAALFRQGLPTLGVSSFSPLRPHLQALPLRLALAFRPRDPFRAAELLLLPGAPLPSQVRRRLLGALSQMPGIGSPAWREAVGDAIAETERRARDGGASESEVQRAGRDLAERIGDWFGGDDFDPRDGIPPAEAASLCAMVASWAGARVAAAERDASPVDAMLWAQAATVARTLERVLAARPPDERIPQFALAQLHDLAARGGSDVAGFEGEAGRPALCTASGAVVPGARSVVWFGFVQGAGPAPSREPWTDPERRGLADAGVHVAEPGAWRRFEAWGWRRPQLIPSERGILVRWRLAGPEPVGAHPFVDELRTRIAPGGLDACMFSSERLLAGAPSRHTPVVERLEPAAPIAPRPVWKVPPATLRPSAPFSATSLEALLGCPFRWALAHQAQLRPGRAIDLPGDSRLLGDFAHRILQDMVLGEERLDLATSTPDDATAWALDTFDARVATEAAPLVRPGREVERDAARTLVGGAAAALTRHLKAGKWRPTEAEKEVHGTFVGKPVHGYVDLVLERGGTAALLDFKLSGGKYRLDELRKGQALQIALYASMLGGGSALPPTGFLTLDDGQLLTTSPQSFPGATAVDGPSSRETLRGAEVMFKAWEGVFAKGILPICSARLPWEEPVVESAGPLPDDELARREPSCQFCTFTTMCRTALRDEVSP